MSLAVPIARPLASLSRLDPETLMIELIPKDQLRLWADETEAARAYVTRWVSGLMKIWGRTGINSEFAQLAAEMHEMPGTVRKNYYYLMAGLKGECRPLWEDLIDRKRYPLPGQRDQLPSAFLDYWKSKIEAVKRVNDGMASAHKSLLAELDRWARGEDGATPIPGYTAPPPLDGYCSYRKRRVPTGWGYRNLSLHKPSEFARKLAQQGPKAASQNAPMNYRTRVGLHFLELICFDDEVSDQKVTLPGLNGGMPFRPLSFHALDVLTGAFLTHSTKVTRWDEDAEVKRVLTGADFVWAVLGTLRHGYRDDDHGTTLIFEHGTATGYRHFSQSDDESFDAKLYALSGGRITVKRSGRFDQPAIAQAFFPGGKQPAGNSRFKSWIESAFHLVRTSSAGLLGQVGSNQRLNGPESDAALARYVGHVAKALDSLPEGRQKRVIDLLRLPFHSFGEWSELTSLVYQAIHERIDHNLEGYTLAGPCGGFVVNEYEIMDGGGTVSRDRFLTLSPEHQAAIQAIANPVSRAMSPSEAVAQCMAAEKGKLARFGSHLVPLLVPPTEGRKVKVNKNYEFHVIDRQKFGPEPLIFLASVRDHRGIVDLRPGAEYCGYIDPFRLDTMVITDSERRYIGEVRRFEKATATHTAAILANQGRINEFKKRIAAPVERRQDAATQQMAADREWNKKLLSGEPLTPEEMEQAAITGEPLDPDRITPDQIDFLDAGPDDEDEFSLSAEELLEVHRALSWDPTRDGPAPDFEDDQP